MTDMATIGRFLDSPDWTEGEKWVIKWQFDLLGGFQKAFANAVKQADEQNLLRLAAGFPTEVRAFDDWAHGNLGGRLRAAGLGI